jgi:3-oxoacyl-[acyl-carrier-protein] synthase II
MTKRQRVVITGMGVVSPLGLSVTDTWNSLLQGRSGIGPITLCETDGFPCRIAGEVKHFDPTNYMDVKESKRMARFSQLAVSAARGAVEQSGLNFQAEDRERLGIVLGTGIGGLPTTEEGVKELLKKGGMRVKPYLIPMILPNMAAAAISRIWGIKGYSNTVSTACAAGTQAIGEGAELIRRGVSDVVISGGTEAGISVIGLAGFCVMHALSSRNDEPDKASRPFDMERDGFVPAEGAGIVILESLDHALRREANILAEVLGYGASSDAFHVVQPDETGQGAALAIRKALLDAGVESSEIDYINAHGTSTRINDKIETMALKQVFSENAYKIPISSTKSMIGHSLGASGGIEAIACVKTLIDGEIHPTANYEKSDPDCDLDYVPNVSRKKEVKLLLSNSFGFGGQNASLVFKKFQ